MKSTIVVRSSGQVLPDAYAELFLKDAKAFGVAVVNDGKITVDSSIYDSDNPPMTTADLKELLDQFKNSVAVLWTSKDETHEDDVQPFQVLVDKDDNPNLVMFVTGEYPGSRQTDSTLSDGYWLAEKQVAPYVLKMARGIETDMSKLLNEFNDELNQNILKNMITGTGSLTFVCDSWDPITISKGEGTSSFGWGWVSDTLGYKETPPASVVEQPKATTGGLLKRNRSILSSNAPPAAQPDPAPLKPGAVEGPKVPDKATPKTDIEAAHAELAERETEHQMIGPPKELKGKSRKNWFQQNCQFVPTNFFEETAVAPAKKTVAKDFKDIKVTSTHVPDPKTNAPDDDAIAGISDQHAIKLKANLVNLDRNHKAMPDDPKQIQALEAKHGNFFTTIGQDETYLDGKPFEWYHELAKLDPKAVALVAFTLKSRIRELDADIEALSAPPAAVSGKVETPEAQAAPAAAPRSGLLKRRA